MFTASPGIDAVAFYGKLGPGHGPYVCNVNKSLDKLQTISGDGGMFLVPAEQQLLCSFVGLSGSSPTNITILNNATSISDNNLLSIDVVEMWGPTWFQSPPSQSSSVSIIPTQSQSQSPSPSTSHHSSHVGAISGGVVGGIALLVALAALYTFIRRPRERARDRKSASTATTALSPYNGTANTGATGYDSTITNGIVRTNSRRSVPMSEWTAPATRMGQSPGPNPGDVLSPGTTATRNVFGYDPSPLMDLDRRVGENV